MWQGQIRDACIYVCVYLWICMDLCVWDAEDEYTRGRMTCGIPIWTANDGKKKRERNE